MSFAVLEVLHFWTSRGKEPWDLGQLEVSECWSLDFSFQLSNSIITKWKGQADKPKQSIIQPTNLNKYSSQQIKFEQKILKLNRSKK